MSDGTKIEWTDASWNPIRAHNLSTGRIGWYCEHVSPGCEHCYAGTMNGWRGMRLPYKPGHRGDIEIFIDEKTLLQPFKWKKWRRIFPCSMTDLFADFIPDEMIDRVFAIMALARQHRFQVLTKRSARMRAYMANLEREAKWMNAVGRILEDRSITGFFPIVEQREEWLPLPNVWLGVSAEDQKRADERIPDLLATPAAVRFASLEPLLGPIDLRAFVDLPVQNELVPGYPAWSRGLLPSLDWVITGGESGPHARPCHPQWVRSIRDQCTAAGVAYFHKQWGEWHADALLYTTTDGQNPPPDMKIGKRRAGRLLDGVEHNEMPRRA